MNPSDLQWLNQTVELALQGEGSVEPNPMVGCVVVRDGVVVGSGWHRRFGGPHAEVEALRDVPAELAAGATVYVSLEPCCHFGKTPPCTQWLASRRVARVVAGAVDPNPAVAGKGLAELRRAGIEVELADSFLPASELIRPFAKLTTEKLPWIIAKWAMTLDGKIATFTGESQWISGEASRAEVHHWRGKVDGILTGIGTVLRDNPLLTARPAGPRTPLRAIADRQLRLPLDSRLVTTARETPLLVLSGPDADPRQRQRLEQAGVEVFCRETRDPAQLLGDWIRELGRRNLTNLMVESGGGLMGSLFEGGWIDEIRCFVAPQILGGATAPGPVAGTGFRSLIAGPRFAPLAFRGVGDDLLLVGRRPISQNAGPEQGVRAAADPSAGSER